MLAGDSISNNGGVTKRDSLPMNDTGNRMNRSTLKDKRNSLVHHEMTAPEPEISMMKVPEDDQVVENNTDKSIDFNAQLQALKKRTESELPHTLSQVEDAMYLDQYNIIVLEYHYY